MMTTRSHSVMDAVYLQYWLDIIETAIARNKLDDVAYVYAAGKIVDVRWIRLRCSPRRFHVFKPDCQSYKLDSAREIAEGGRCGC